MSATSLAASKTVATIGSKKYTSLEKAIAAVQDGETITLKAAVTYTSKLTISRSGKSFTIDLNKQTLTFKNSACLYVKKGTVTIKNGTLKHTSKSGTVLKVASTAKVTIASGTYTGFVSNAGTMTIKKGTFSNVKLTYEKWNTLMSELTVTTISDRYAYSVIQNSGTLKISGGTFKSTYLGLIYNTGAVTISGGTFKPGTYWEYPAITNMTKTATMKISGGTFTSSGDLLYNDVKASLTITKGTFSSTGWHFISNSGTMKISSGTFTQKEQSMRSIYNSGTGSMTISGGTYKLSIAISNLGTAKITGGTFKPYTSSYSYDLYSIDTYGSYITDESGNITDTYYGKTTISGGKFYLPIYASANCIYDSDGNVEKSYYGKITVSGGTFYMKKSAAYVATDGGKITFKSGVKFVS